MVLCRSDVRYCRTAETHVADVQHGVLSDGDCPLWLFQFQFHAVVRHDRQSAVHLRIAVLVSEAAVERNVGPKTGRTSVDPVRFTGGHVARVQDRVIGTGHLIPQHKFTTTSVRSLNRKKLFQDVVKKKKQSAEKVVQRNIL